MVTDPLLIAWAAGLFEGEGSISFRSNKQGWRFGIRLSMSMTDKDVVERFSAVVGYGSISGPVIPRPGTKEQWRWQTSQAEAVATIGDLFRPYLGERRRARLDEVLGAYHAQPPRRNHNTFRTHCRHGHEYAVGGIIVWGRGRRCRICEQVRWTRKNAAVRLRRLTVEDVAAKVARL